MERGVYFTPGNEVRAIRLGIPSKGRGQLQVWKLLESCKILPPYSEDLRENPPSLDKSIIVVAERQLDIIRDLGISNLDLGIAGEDIIMELGYPLEVISRLGYGKCRVSLIAPPNFGPFDSMRIATKLPNITKKFLDEMKWNAEIIEREGALEMAIKQGIADAIVDQVATGKTIASFGLKEKYTITESQFVLASNRSSLKTMGAEIEGIKTMVEGVNAARNKNLVTFNIPNKNLELLIKNLPTCKSPTISQLANKNWSSVSTVVPDELLRKTIAEIKNNGGEDLLVTQISVYLDEQKSRQTIVELYERILEREMNPVIFSRTTRYLRNKRALADKFIGECKEFVDAIRSGKKEGKDGIIWEAADSLYFFLVMAASTSSIQEVNLEIEGTEKQKQTDFLRISEAVVGAVNSAGFFVGSGPDNPEEFEQFTKVSENLRRCLDRWIASWRYLLSKNGVSEEEIELENGWRNKG